MRVAYFSNFKSLFRGSPVRRNTRVSRFLMQSLPFAQDESRSNCLLLFSSHLIELDDDFNSFHSIKKCYFEARESEAKLEFDYVLHPGVSSQRLGMRVLSDEGVLHLLDN